MDAINVKIDVKIDLSEDAKSFIASLFKGNAQMPAATQAKQAPAPAPKPVPAPKPAPAPETEPDPQPKPKPVQAPAPKPVQAPAASSTTLTVEDIRKELALKINVNRQEIKEKLTQLGAPNVTTLDVSKYEEFMAFLKELLPF